MVLDELLSSLNVNSFFNFQLFKKPLHQSGFFIAPFLTLLTGFNLSCTTVPRWGVSDLKPESPRSEFYPILSAPRYYRQEMLNSVLKYQETKNPQFLGAYSYWYKRWSDEFSYEAQRQTDRVWGMASDTTLKHLVKSHNKEQSDPITLDEFYKKYYLPQIQSEDHFTQENEALKLGPVVAMILEEKLGSQWQKQMTQSSPLELLASLQTPLRQNTNNELQNEFLVRSVKAMEKVDPRGQLDNLFEKLANNKFHRLVVPHHLLKKLSLNDKDSPQKNMYFISFFNFNGLSGLEFIPYSQPMTLMTPLGEVTYRAGDFRIMAQKTPCSPSDKSTLFLVKPTEISIQNKKISFKNKPANKTPVRLIQEHSTVWYCL